MNIKNLSKLKILEIIWYFLHPGFFTNLTFIVSMIFVYNKYLQPLPHILTLNLFILIIGSFIAIFFARSVINVAMSRLNITNVNIPKFSGMHFLIIFIGIIIHVVMTIILKWSIKKQYTQQEIKTAETYADKHRINIALSCIGIVFLYLLTGLYTVYGMNNYTIAFLIIVGPIVMYLCTYLDDYYFFEKHIRTKQSL